MGSTVLSILKKITNVGQKQGLYKKGEKLIDVYGKLKTMQSDKVDPEILKQVINVIRDKGEEPDEDEAAQKLLADQRNKSSDIKMLQDSPRIDELIDEFQGLLLTVDNKDVNKERERRNRAE